MALLQNISLPVSSLKLSFPHEIKSSYLKKGSFNLHDAAQPRASYKVYNTNQTITRRSANFQPSIWSYDYIQSLSTEYKEEIYTNQVRVLREKVRMMFCKVESELDQLEFIDLLQRLGVEYHYQNEIRNVLDNIYKTETSNNEEKNLHATSLKFRLLRQHGYDISSDFFICFKEENGNLKKCEYADVEGMLSLYEASFHSFEDENILDELKDFASKFLKEYLNKSKGNYISHLIDHALDLPLHWRVPKFEAQWFINAYQKKENSNPDLLHLAKLDFNISQAIYLEELKESSRWWKQEGLGEKLSFSRERLVDNYIWAVGANSRLDLDFFRKNMTKIISLITLIDDVYDVYGTLEELELFTEVIDRCDLCSMHSLPDYMKICFQALYNFVNEMASEYPKKNELNINITSYLMNAWANLCKAFLNEAKWYHSGYTPSFEEYIHNGLTSSSVPLLLTHSYFLIPNSFKEEEFKNLEEFADIICFAAKIFRLVNDIGTYKREDATGDVPKSPQCYMNQSGASEAEAREHLTSVIHKTWKKLNEATHYSSFSQGFKDTARNFVNVAIWSYQHGDGYTIHDPEIQNLIRSLMIQPILP